MVKKKILFISRNDDQHVPQVLDAVEALGHEVIYLKTNELLSAQYSWQLTKGVSTFHLNGLPIKDTQAVWLRRPDLLLEEQDGATREYLQIELGQLIDTVCNAVPSGAHWISHPHTLSRARDKLAQLVVAQNLGIRTPATLMSTDEEDIVQFFKEHKEGVVAKALRAQVVSDPASGASHMIRTRGINQNEAVENSATGTPLVLQQHIHGSREIRVVIMGSEVFAFSIKPQTNSEEYWDDIKDLALSQLTVTPCSLPNWLDSKLTDLVQGFGLEFSSLDLIEDQDGELYFIDLNPNGQWMWLDYLTEIDLVSPFAKLLCL